MVTASLEKCAINISGDSETYMSNFNQRLSQLDRNQIGKIVAQLKSPFGLAHNFTWPISHTIQRWTLQFRILVFPCKVLVLPRSFRNHDIPMNISFSCTDRPQIDQYLFFLAITDRVIVQIPLLQAFGYIFVVIHCSQIGSILYVC